MSDSREESPDWLRAFQAPSQAFFTLSSASESSPEGSPTRSDHTRKEPKKPPEDSILIDSGEESPVIKTKKQKTVRTKPNQKLKEDTLDVQDDGPVEEDIREKPSGPTISSRLPLVFPDKVQRSKALVECDGDSIDLSGDVGAVGRIVISNGPAGNEDMLLDLKGTLDGFSFDSEEEADKLPKSSVHQSDQKNGKGDQPDAKTKIEKSSGMAHKKAKSTARPSKKAAKKSQVVKKTKRKK
uniref:DNA-binding protein BIN4 isoform X4 n=1 Tax=Elaeis guineensis var. tenera TaxID=51953 RepID=A0A6I9RIT9_ELAGV|nr:DNA-binding protein BIN4 isoform X4 [Elaeis guineensis]